MTTVELLAEMIGTLPADEDTEAALDFLGQPDLIRIVPAAEEANVASAQHWLRIYKIRQATTTEAGIVTRGFPLLLSALEKLHPTELVAVTVFAAPNGTAASGQIRMSASWASCSWNVDLPKKSKSAWSGFGET